uniref:Uncharacterized protein n=1 Tax=Spongospora subterranea TaxID=70186 RepID=A0A0H5QSS1_9EUKA|eukprot:CRZ04731.1 hypothetical protein [Spongospora subterranea]
MSITISKLVLFALLSHIIIAHSDHNQITDYANSVLKRINAEEWTSMFEYSVDLEGVDKATAADVVLQSGSDFGYVNAVETSKSLFESLVDEAKANLKRDLKADENQALLRSSLKLAAAARLDHAILSKLKEFWMWQTSNEKNIFSDFISQADQLYHLRLLLFTGDETQRKALALAAGTIDSKLNDIIDEKVLEVLGDKALFLTWWQWSLCVVLLIAVLMIVMVVSCRYGRRDSSLLGAEPRQVYLMQSAPAPSAEAAVQASGQSSLSSMV